MKNIINELMKEGALKANGLVVSLILISCGIVMLIDHIGLSANDIDLIDSMGLVFLIGGSICISLQIYILKSVLSRPSESNSEELK